MNKEIAARNRARRIRSMIRRGMTQEQIDKYFSDKNTRMVLCILYGSFTITDGTKKKTVKKRDKHHKVISTETVEIPNVLRGVEAAKKFAQNEKMELVGNGVTSIWVKTDKDNVDDVVKKLSELGRTSVTIPEQKAEKVKKEKKPTNNTAEVKAAAKAARKEKNVEKTNMRPYYAALRKGGVSKRIKKYNKTLADKIEKWIKEKKASEASRVKGSKEERAKHRQWTSIEMKANKRARKAAKHLAAQERRKAQEKVAVAKNQAITQKRAQEAAKHGKNATQQPLKQAA